MLGLHDFKEVLSKDRYLEFLKFWKKLENKTTVDYIVYTLLRGRTTTQCLSISRRSGKTSAERALMDVWRHKALYKRRPETYKGEFIDPRCFSSQSLKFLTDEEFEKFLDELYSNPPQIKSMPFYVSDFRI